MAGKIKTMVVVVQENRSFDHMLGWMKSLNADIDGVTGAQTNHVVVADPSSKTVTFSDRSEYVDPDPGHSVEAINEQVYGTPFVDAHHPARRPRAADERLRATGREGEAGHGRDRHERVQAGRRAGVPRAGAGVMKLIYCWSQ